MGRWIHNILHRLSHLWQFLPDDQFASGCVIADKSSILIPASSISVSEKYTITSQNKEGFLQTYRCLHPYL